MRDELDITNNNTYELSPLIPEPPVKRNDQPQSWIRRSWNFFQRCSRWTCLIFLLILIIIILLVVREFLPFGWLEWVPVVSFNKNDPHIILIVADDLGWQDVSYGGSEFTTTSIDSLAEEGITLNRFYVSAEDSSNRASLLTGKYGYRMGLQNGMTVGSGAHVPLDTTLLPKILADKNYATHLVGKWNLGYSKWSYTPTERGFHSFIGYHQSWIDYWEFSTSNERDNEQFYGWDLWTDKNVYDLSIDKRTYSTELFTEAAVSLIHNHVNGDTPDRPLFLMYSAPNPHTPIEYHMSHDECADISTSLRKNYCNSVQALDRSLDAIISALKENDIWDRSLIILLSDNGGAPCYDVGNDDACSGSVNMPLRGGRSTLFDGGIRVRALMSGGYIPESKRGSTSDTLMHITDLFPTVLRCANVTQATIDRHNVDGIDYYDYLINDDSEADQRKQVIIEVQKNDAGNLIKGAIISGNYKYIIQPSEEYDGWWSSPIEADESLPTTAEPSTFTSDEVVEGLSTENNKIEYHEYLFDINADSEEKINLYNSLPEIVSELRKILIDIAASEDYTEPQESSMHEDSLPNKFGGIWYPFEEEYSS